MRLGPAKSTFTVENISAVNPIAYLNLEMNFEMLVQVKNGIAKNRMID
jgi:hypothetical protein